jgi:hypothetical protein
MNNIIPTKKIQGHVFFPYLGKYKGITIAMSNHIRMSLLYKRDKRHEGKERLL